MIQKAKSPVQPLPLACPACGGDLVHGDEGLACRCARGFRVGVGPFFHAFARKSP
jgi:hypothetical protein